MTAIKVPANAKQLAPPVFQEQQGFVVVTFRAEMVAGAATPQVTPHVAGQVGGQVTGQVLEFCRLPRKASEIQELFGIRHRETFINNYPHPFLEIGWIERTILYKSRRPLALSRYNQSPTGMKEQ